MTDAELVRQTLAGQTDSFAELVRRWSGRVTALCHGKVGRTDVAEDLAQEALLRSFRALNTLSAPEKFGPWLCGIAQRACLDWLKSKQRKQVPFSLLGDDQNPADFLTSHDGPPEYTVGQEDEARQLLAKVEALPEECREVVMLYYYEDLTYRDVARLLGVSPATINARLTRARALLRERLSSCWR